MKGALTSPSFRENKADQKNHPTKKIGCMPGIFFFFHRHNHHHSRKRISSAKKAEKNIADPVPCSNPGEKRVALKRAGSPDIARSTGGELRNVSCDVPRSPTLPAEIRRMNFTVVDGESSPKTPRKPPALVARLMGLDDIPVSSPASAAEKRRKLLGALEKCDEDLKALKRIIDAVRLGESGKLLLAGATESAKEWVYGPPCLEKKRCSEQDLSPVSVINGIRSPSSPRHPQPPEFGQGDHVENNTNHKEKIIIRKTKKNSRRTPTKAEGGLDFFKRTSIERPSKTDIGSRKGAAAGGGKCRRITMMCSKAMEESVEEVWKEGFVEEMWEPGRVGVALEGGIFWDLVEEMVEELGGGVAGRILPFDACRRRLCF